MNNSFDVIVIGIGSMGSSACYYLAKRGYKVLGLEQFDIPHELGAHAGQSRIIRKAYFEDSNYVPLLDRAYKNWKDLEDETGTQLYFRTGLVYFGRPGHELMKGVKRSASLYDIQLEQIDTSSVAKRFPQFKIPENFEVLFEPDAGFLPPGKAILLYTKQAISKGAEIHTHEKVIDWKKEKKELTVTTTKDIYRCNKIVITTGPWAGKMIPGFHDVLKITRQTLAWVKPKYPDDFSLNHFPCWMIADDEQPGVYYGFPVLPVKTFGEPGGVKLAHHYPGVVTDPDNVNRQSNVEDEKTLKHALDKYFSAEFESGLSVKTCLYANSPDENFIIDHLPGYEDQVAIACGFSGHGFKFVSVVGEILADLTIQGNTNLPIGFLNAKRFA